MAVNKSTLEPVDWTLDELNYEKVRVHIGAVIILALLIIPGVVGNAHILHIYGFKKPASTTRVFVLFMATIDLVACTVCFPSILVNYLLSLKIYMSLDPFCRILTFLTIYVTVGEALSLLAIAVDRYRRICEPFERQITIRFAKIVCLAILVVAFFLTLPVPILVGSTEKRFTYTNVTGYECNVVEQHKGSTFEKSFYGCILFVSVGACIILSVLYTLIGMRVWRHQAKINTMDSLPSTKADDCEMTIQETEIDRAHTPELGPGTEMAVWEPDDTTDPTDSVRFRSTSTEETSFYQETTEEMSSTVLKTLDKGYKSKRNVVLKKKDIKKFKKLKKPIYMFTLLTALYVLSYIPYPLLKLYQSLNTDFYKNLDYPGRVVFHSTRCFLFLNHVINSFIYMIFDAKYRRELKSFYSWLLRRK